MEADHCALRERIGVHRYRQRMNVQAYHASKAIGQGRTIFHPENLPMLRLALRTGLRCVGLWGWGRRNAHALQVRENRVAFRRLPPAFEGYRMLQLSDLHLDIDPGITTALLRALEGIEAEVCVITGDFRSETWGPYEAAIHETGRVIEALTMPVYGILGNHDFLEMITPLEKLGIRMLLNEGTQLNHEGESIFLAGVDDPHFYETDDLENALRNAPPEATKILLCHTAEPHRQALACGIDLMLCGHTHGGQFCLPGGYALLHNAQHPRYMTQGAWRYQDLQGYTSAGAGCSVAPVRYFCPPEITLHIFERATHADQ